VSEANKLNKSFLQAHSFYDFEEVIDSDEELNLDAMDSSSTASR
jgi:hypothetical protein